MLNISPSCSSVCSYSYGVKTLKNIDWEGSLFKSGAKAFGRQKIAYFYSDTLPFDLDCGMLTDVFFFGYITTCHVESRSPLNPTG